MSAEVNHKTNESTEQQATVASRKISASKRGSERLVIVSVISLFLMLEACFRFGGEYLSKDITHLQSFESISQQLAQFNPKQGTRLLFLGNSLTRHGIDQEAFARVVEQEFGQKIQCVKMNPDNTALADWFYAYRTYFSNPGVKPDLVIIGFEGIHLRDAPSNHPDRLAQYYCTWADYPQLFKYDLNNFEERVHFSLCKVSAAFGNRDRIQKRALDLLIPDYRAGIEQLNHRRNQHATPPLSSPGYERLEELISIASKQGTQIVLAAMPVPEAYEFDPELLELVENSSAILFDCRTVPGITDPMFFDGLHMDEQAASLYSTTLARKSGSVIKNLWNP